MRVPSVPAIVIDDADDPRLAEYVGLTDPQLRQRVEAERQFFIAESPLVVEALVRSGRTVRSVLVTPGQHDAIGATLVGVDAPVYIARPEVLRKVVGFDLHRGAVASADRWPTPPPQSGGIPPAPLPSPAASRAFFVPAPTSTCSAFPRTPGK